MIVIKLNVKQQQQQQQHGCQTMTTMSQGTAVLAIPVK